MKIRVNKKVTTNILFLNLATAVFCGVLLTTGGSLMMVLFIGAYLISLITFMLTVGRSAMSVMTMDEQGVSSKFLGRRQGSLRWEEMAEVGVGMEGFGKKKQHFLYFVRYPLNEFERHMILRMKHNANALWVELNKQSLEAVNKYYHGYIRQMEMMI